MRFGTAPLLETEIHAKKSYLETSHELWFQGRRLRAEIVVATGCQCRQRPSCHVWGTLSYMGHWLVIVVLGVY
jgi:hypothetical protein